MDSKAKCLRENVMTHKVDQISEPEATEAQSRQLYWCDTGEDAAICNVPRAPSLVIIQVWDMRKQGSCAAIPLFVFNLNWNQVLNRLRETSPASSYNCSQEVLAGQRCLAGKPWHLISLMFSSNVLILRASKTTGKAAMWGPCESQLAILNRGN